MSAQLQAILNEHLRAENAHDLEATLATLHPECVFEEVATGEVYHGRAGAAQHYRKWWDAFGLTFARGDHGSGRWAADGSFVAEGEFHGRHVGPFRGIAPTGKEVCFRFCVFVGFRDGLLASERFYYDLSSVLRPLGAAPASAPRAAR